MEYKPTPEPKFYRAVLLSCLISIPAWWLIGTAAFWLWDWVFH